MKLLCEVMCVQRSGYYLYVQQLKQPHVYSEAKLLVEVKVLGRISRSIYGSRQIAKNLY